MDFLKDLYESICGVVEFHWRRKTYKGPTMKVTRTVKAVRGKTYTRESFCCQEDD